MTSTRSTITVKSLASILFVSEAAIFKLQRTGQLRSRAIEDVVAFVAASPKYRPRLEAFRPYLDPQYPQHPQHPFQIT